MTVKDKELINAVSQIATQVIAQWSKMPPEQKAFLETKGETLPRMLADAIVTSKSISIKPKDRILVVSDQGIGNVVMLTPTLRALKLLYPNTKIDVLCKSPADQVIRGWDILNEVKTSIDDSVEYDVGLFTFWSQDYKKKYAGILQKVVKRSYDINVFDSFDIHEAQYNLDLAKVCGFEDHLPEPHCEIDTSVLEEYNLQNLNNLVAISDTTLDLPVWQIKRYPHYPELAQELINRGYSVVLIGGKAEKEDLKNHNYPSGVITSLLGEITIPQTAAVLKHCKFGVFNDSGPAHISGAVGTETFVLFGPTKVSKNRPLGKHVHPIVLGKTCSPCQYTKNFGKCKPQDCLGQIPVSKVLSSIADILKWEKASVVKDKAILVGVFSNDNLRTEFLVEKYLEKKGWRVERFPYRELAQRLGPEGMTAKLIKKIVETDPKLIFICGGQQLAPNILEKFRGIVDSKAILWYLDNRGGVENWLVGLGKQCDAIFWSTGDKRMLSQLSALTHTPSYFMHSTSDSEIAKTLETYYEDKWNEEKEKYQHDVVYVGTYYKDSRKTKMLDEFKEKGIDVKVWGPPGWPEKYTYLGGPVLGKEMLKAFRYAKISLSMQYVHNVKQSFSDRLFHAAMSGAFQLVEYVPGLEEIFENKKHLVWYKNVDEAIKLIRYYLEHDDERKEIAKAGQEYFMKYFNYDKVIHEILELTLVGKRYENIFTVQKKKDLPQIALFMPTHNFTVFNFYHETEKEMEKFFDIGYNSASNDDKFCLTIAEDTTVRNFRGIEDTGTPVIPMVLDLPMFRIDHPIMGPQLKRYIQMIESAPCALGLSQATCDVIKKETKQKNVYPWYIGFDITKCDLKPFEQIEPENQVVFISRFVERKYPMDILKALKKVREETGTTLKAVFITTNADQNLINKCGDYGTKARVPFEFKGIHLEDYDNKIKEIRKSICLVSASTFEGLGITPGESLYCKRPAVITDIPSHVEAYEGCASYFKPHDINGMAKQIIRFLNNPEEAKKVGETGHELVIQKFTPEKSAKDFHKKVYPFILRHIE